MPARRRKSTPAPKGRKTRGARRVVGRAAPAAPRRATQRIAQPSTPAPVASEVRQGATVQDLAPTARANAAVVDGLREIGAEMADYAQRSLDETVGFARALIEARSLADVMAVQQRFAQVAFDTLLAKSARFSAIGIAAASRMLTPAAGSAEG